MLRGFKSIAAYISALRGEDFSAERARKAVGRAAKYNPLPVQWEGTRPVMSEALVRTWNTNEIGRRMGRSDDSKAA